MKSNKEKLISELIRLVLYITIRPYVIMLLWNWLAPIILDLPTINFLQAIGIMVLSSSLVHDPEVLFNLQEANRYHEEAEKREGIEAFITNIQNRINDKR